MGIEQTALAQAGLFVASVTQGSTYSVSVGLKIDSAKRDRRAG
jgi:hypothetical protein